MRLLSPEPLTREAFRPFGDVIEMEGSAHVTINQGFAERFNDLAHMDVAAEGGSPNVSLFLGAPRGLPIEIRLMERHPLGSQIFYPLQDRPWLVLGPAVEAPWRHLDLSAHVVRGLRNGEQVAEGTGKAVLGGPLKALTWFVNEASRFCGGVKAGQFVTTGTCIIPMAIASGDEVRADYGPLGAISCRIV